MSNESWLEELYSKNYNDMLKSLESRFSEPSLSALEEITGLLNHYYVYQGNNWEGRGPVQEVSIEATINALEDFKILCEQGLRDKSDKPD